MQSEDESGWFSLPSLPVSILQTYLGDGLAKKTTKDKQKLLQETNFKARGGHKEQRHHCSLYPTMIFCEVLS